MTSIFRFWDSSHLILVVSESEAVSALTDILVGKTLILCDVVPTVKYVYEFQSERLNENYLAVLSVVLFNKMYKVMPAFESVDEFLSCDHLNESY